MAPALGGSQLLGPLMTLLRMGSSDLGEWGDDRDDVRGSDPLLVRFSRRDMNHNGKSWRFSWNWSRSISESCVCFEKKE